MREHHKDFDGWNDRKKKIDKDDRTIYFKEREIWWCSVGINIGYEQDGKGLRFWRPIVIVKKFNRHLFEGTPLTSQCKSGQYYMPVGVVSGRSAIAVLSQTRPLSSKRLVNKIGVIDKSTFLEMKKVTSDCIFGDPSLSPSSVNPLTAVPEGEAEAHYIYKSTP